MSELSGAEYPKVSKDELLHNAERLFVDIAFASFSAEAAPNNIEGRVAPELILAVKAEYDRDWYEELERQKQKEAEWRQRSIGRAISDLLKRQSYYDFVGTYRPKPDVGEIAGQRRGITGSLPLGEGWPKLLVSVEQSYFEGSVAVAGQEFALDPSAHLLRVHLSYPLSDGTRTDLGVTHTMYPYKDQVETNTHSHSGIYWKGVPHEPFTNRPADPSIYMNRAMVMLTDEPKGFLFL